MSKFASKRFILNGAALLIATALCLLGKLGGTEWVYALGVVLLLITLAYGLTGYLLPWDNRAYFGTVVTTRIAGQAPVIGPYLTRFLGGGGAVQPVAAAAGDLPGAPGRPGGPVQQCAELSSALPVVSAFHLGRGRTPGMRGASPPSDLYLSSY